MKVREIAQFLNISEKDIKSLIKQGALPGKPSADGWESSLSEIEKWYNNLTGQEWADLLSDGKVKPLEAQVIVDTPITKILLEKVLLLWEKRGILETTTKVKKKGKVLSVQVFFREASIQSKEGVKTLDNSNFNELERAGIGLVLLCEKIIGESIVVITIIKNRNIKLCTTDAMEKRTEREREIIKYLLLCYARRFCDELKRAMVG